jgi:hypothetical protein
LISLQDSLIFFAILLLIALVLAPVWRSDQIFGSAIIFLRKLGLFLPGSVAEAAQYRSFVTRIINVYQSLNIVYYLTISMVAFLFIVNRIRLSSGIPTFSNKVWMVLGIALLVFPIANLVISLNMFLTAGVIGTTLAAIIVICAGVIDQ